MISNGTDKLLSQRLYRKNQIDEIPWSLNHYLANYVAPLMQNGTLPYFANIKSEVAVLQVNDILMPLTVNNSEYDNCYVCSPYTTYVSYLLEELKHIHQPILRFLLTKFIKLKGKIFKLTHINKIVYINNWMLSTNLYENKIEKYIPQLTDFILQNFNSHAISFRSLNHFTNKGILESCRKRGFLAIPSRIVYISDCRSKECFRTRDLKQDLRDLKKTNYIQVSHDGITKEDYARIVDLYNMLYIDKYSDKNVQFTIEFIELCHQNNLLMMRGLRDTNGVLVGIIGSFVRDGVLTTPLLGYDLFLPQDTGLYRLLSAMIQLLASENDAICNNSSGVGKFKRLRGAKPHIEYSLVYIKHLNLWRRLPWYLLNIITNKMIAPFVKKKEL